MDLKTLGVIFNVMGFGISLIAAWYWHNSAKTKLPSIDPKTRQPVAPVSMSELNATAVESARSNRVAAILTAIATLLLGVGGFLTSVGNA